jgi:hypothetical protein
MTSPALDPSVPSPVRVPHRADRTRWGTCGLCDAPLHRAGQRWCSERCRKRAARGLPAQAQAKAYGSKLSHDSYIIEPCPACGFPEADGGYCPDCGWTAPRVVHPYGSLHGPVGL